MAEAEGLLLLDVDEVDPIGQAVHLVKGVEEVLLPALLQVVLDLTGTVEVVDDGALPATDDHDHLLDPRLDRLLHPVLDGRLVYQGEHLFGLRLGDRQEASSQPGRCDDRFANRNPAHSTQCTAWSISAL